MVSIGARISRAKVCEINTVSNIRHKDLWYTNADDIIYI